MKSSRHGQVTPLHGPEASCTSPLTGVTVMMNYLCNNLLNPVCYSLDGKCHEGRNQARFVPS